MEQVHKRRLKRLANHLLSFSAEQNAKHFRMRIFLEHDRKELTPTEALAQQVLEDCYCETAACAVGHAPALFPALMKKFDKEQGWEASREVYDSDGNYAGDEKYWVPPTWRQVSLHLFDIGPGSDEFEFLFGGDWDTGRFHDYKGTSWAAADRIFYLLDNPDSYRDIWGAWKGYSAEIGKVSKHDLDKRMIELEALEHSGQVKLATSVWDAEA